MNRKQWIILTTVVLAAVIVAVFITTRVIQPAATDPESTPTTTSPSTPAPSDTPDVDEPEEPTTPEDVSTLAIAGLLAGDNSDACRFFTEDAFIQETRKNEPDVQKPMSQWCPDGGALGQYDGAHSFAIVAAQTADDSARVGLEFQTINSRSRVGVSLVKNEESWLIDKWCFYQGDYPDGMDSVLTCVDGDDE